MRIEEADKKRLSVLYLAHGNEGKKIFSQKFTQVQILLISFKEFWEILSVAFMRKANVTFERPDFLNSTMFESFCIFIAHSVVFSTKSNADTPDVAFFNDNIF